MVWGSSDVEKIPQIDRSADALLGFNEPDNCNGQSCMSVDEAVRLWPQLRATGMRLGSPAVTTGGGDWLGSFLYRVGCGPQATPPCQVDFLALHYYGACDAQSFHAFLENWRRPYPDLPLWVTEFSCPSFSSGGGTVEDNLRFMQSALPGIGQAAPTLERYAWFATRTYANKGSTTGYENTTQFKECGVGRSGPLAAAPAREWVVDRFGNSKRCDRVLHEEAKLFGTGIPPAPHASHIEDSLHAMRQTHAKHTANDVKCPYTGRVFTSRKALRIYLATLETIDPKTGLETITPDTIAAHSPERGTRREIKMTMRPGGH
eukprot:g5532.t1